MLLTQFTQKRLLTVPCLKQPFIEKISVASNKPKIPGVTSKRFIAKELPAKQTETNLSGAALLRNQKKEVPMAPYSNISDSLTTSDFNSIVTKLNQVRALMPFLVNLTPDERTGGFALGDKSVAFVNKALQYAESNPHLVPAFLDMNEFKDDMELRAQVEEILQLLKSLTEAVDDTYYALGKELMQHSANFYNSAKQAAKNNVAGSTTIANDLSARFPGGSKEEGEETGAPESDPDSAAEESSGAPEEPS